VSAVIASLAGRRILVMRAQHQAGRLATALVALGAVAIEIPAIEILPPASFAPLDEALGNVHRYDWLLVTSANAVNAIVERLRLLGLTPSIFASLRIAAAGSSTATALRSAGLQVALTPPVYVAESLLAALGEQMHGLRVLLVRAAVARDVIPTVLAGRGARVDVVEAYRTVLAEGSAARMVQAFAEHEPDAAIFTSSSMVTNFFRLTAAAGFERPQLLRAVSIGPITSATLRDHRWEPAAEADPHDIGGVVAATLRALVSGDR
jgi:uroporphyrinogen-III synthase